MIINIIYQFPMLLLGVLFFYIRKAFIANKPVESQKIKFLSVTGIIFSVFTGLLLIIESIQYSISLFTIISLPCIIIDILCFWYIIKSLINSIYLKKSLKVGIGVSIIRIIYSLPRLLMGLRHITPFTQVIFSFIILIIACNVLKALKSNK